MSIRDAGRLLAEARLVEWRDGACLTPEVALDVPHEIGRCEWTVEFGGIASAGILHEPRALSAVFNTTPHTTSAIAWVDRSQVVTGSVFEVNVGGACSQRCRLAAQIVEVYGEEGVVLGRGRLGEKPWPGTAGLFVASVKVHAPEHEGLVRWSASFAPEKDDPLHPQVATVFTFRTVGSPEHTILVRVIDSESHVAVADALVHAGWHQAVTDDAGVARLEVPKGRYELKARRAGYVMTSVPVDVVADTEVSIEAVSVPEVNPDDAKWM